MTPFPYNTAAQVDIHLDNDIFGKYRPVTFSLGNDSYKLTFLQQIPNYEARFGIKISDGHEFFWLGLNSIPLLAQLDPELENLPIDTLPKDMQIVILESVFAQLLQSAEQPLQRKLSVEDILLEGPPHSFEHQLFFKAKSGNKNSLTGHFNVNRAACELFSNAIKQVPAQSLHQFNKIPLNLSISIGSTLLSENDLKDTHKNDIILIDDNNFIETQRVFLLSSSDHAFQARYANGKITTQ